MAAVSDTDLKKYFETGDKPTQTQFANFIDSKRSVLDKILLTDLHQDIVDILENVSADTNLGNTDQTLISNRQVNGDGLSLSFVDIQEFELMVGDFVVDSNLLKTVPSYGRIMMGDVRNSYNYPVLIDVNNDEELVTTKSPRVNFRDSRNDNYLYLTATNESLQKNYKGNTYEGRVFEIAAGGELFVNTENKDSGGLLNRLSITAFEEVTAVQIANAIFSVIDANNSGQFLRIDPINGQSIGDIDGVISNTRIIVNPAAETIESTALQGRYEKANYYEIANSVGERIFVCSSDGSVTIGSVDGQGYGTKISVDEAGAVVDINAIAGLQLKASSNVNNYGYAVLKTDNLLEGKCTLQMPLENDKTFAVGVNGYYANNSGMIAVPELAFEEGEYTPTVISATTGVTVTPQALKFQRLGNYVTISGTISIQKTATNSATINISLPTTSTTNYAGSGIAIQGNSVSAIALTTASNGSVFIQCASGSSSSLPYKFSFTYKK